MILIEKPPSHYTMICRILFRLKKRSHTKVWENVTAVKLYRSFNLGNWTYIFFMVGKIFKITISNKHCPKPCDEGGIKVLYGMTSLGLMEQVPINKNVVLGLINVSCVT